MLLLQRPQMKQGSVLETQKLFIGNDKIYYSKIDELIKKKGKKNIIKTFKLMSLL